MLQYFEKQLSETKELTQEDIDNLSPTGKAMFSVGDKMLCYEVWDVQPDPEGDISNILFKMLSAPSSKIEEILQGYQFEGYSSPGIPIFKPNTIKKEIKC